MYQEVVEGFLITTKEGLIFEVKGDVHPSNRIIAYLRYIPERNGIRGTARKRYTKITRLDSREIFLKKHYPQYIWYHEQTGREYQSVPYSRIQKIHDPRIFLEALRKRRPENQNEQYILHLTNLLAKISGISHRNIGVTGSHLVHLSTIESDIDLMIFGRNSGEKVYRSMEELFKFNEIRYYKNSSLEEHVNFRWPKLQQYHTQLGEIEMKKKLQGYFKNTEFFIRLVKNRHEKPHQFDDLIVSPKGRIRIVSKIKDDTLSIFTPTEYRITSNKHDIKKIISYRSRFCEHVKEGQNVVAYGSLEKVTNIRENITFHQLVLGESDKDYLIPI